MGSGSSGTFSSVWMLDRVKSCACYGRWMSESLASLYAGHTGSAHAARQSPAHEERVEVQVDAGRPGGGENGATVAFQRAALADGCIPALHVVLARPHLPL